MNNTLIFSVFKGEDYAFDRINHDRVKELLDSYSIKYQVIKGVYKGKHELSFLVDADSIHIVRLIATEYKQESYLRNDHDGGWLVYLDKPEREYLGLMKLSIDRPNTNSYSQLENGLFMWFEKVELND